MARPGKRTILAMTALVAVLAPAAAAAAVPEGSTLLLSRPSGLGALPSGDANDSWLGNSFGNQGGGESSVSADGRYVAFTSNADGLSAEDDNRRSNVFVRDLQTGTTELVSRATGATGAGADGDSNAPSISADGMRVAFVSLSTNVVAGAGPQQGIYVRNRTTHTTTLVSHADGAAGAAANGHSASPSISADGTRVGFESGASNLDAADPNTRSDVYVRILASEDTVLVSRATSAGGAVGDLDSYDPSLDADGSRISFETSSTNFDAADTNGKRDIYRRDLAVNQTALISRAPGVSGAVGNGSSYDAASNGDGSKIAFQSGSTNMSAADPDVNRSIYLRDAGTATTTLVSRADGATGANADDHSFDASIDSAGDTVAFNSWAGNLGTSKIDQGSVYLRELGANSTRLVSRASGPSGAAAESAALGPAISGDGTSVAFKSRASNLAGNDAADFQRVFLRDVDGAEATTLVSRPTGTAAFAGGSNSSGVNTESSVSADGRFVAFHSYADGLLDTTADNRDGGLYVRDSVTGVTEIVSRADGPDGAPGGQYAWEGSISADGSRVAFQSASSLVPADTTVGEEGVDVYVRDRSTGTTTLVSRASGAAGAPGNFISVEPAISADGKRVAFTTYANNLDSADLSTIGSVYVRDLATATTTLVSRADGAAGANGDDMAGNPVLNQDGSRVAFDSWAANLGDGDTVSTQQVHVRDLASGSTTLVSRADGAGPAGNHGSGKPAINADGTRVAFQSDATNVATDSPTGTDIFLRDLTAATTVLVSRGDGAAGALNDNAAFDPSIDASGTRVAFASHGTTFVPGDSNGTSDVFLRDVAAGTTTLVSRADGAGGALGNGASYGASLSASGNCVAFASQGTNLVADGYPSPDFTQVYMRVVRGECAPAPPPGGGGGGAPDTVAPVLDHLGISAKLFRVGKAATASAASAKKKKTAVGTRFTWRLSEPARVTLVIERSKAGRRKGGRCVAPTKKLRKAKRCTRWLAAGKLTRQSAAATTKLVFSGRIGKKALTPGSYRAVVSAVDAAGNVSAKRTVAFRVVKH